MPCKSYYFTLSYYYSTLVCYNLISSLALMNPKNRIINYYYTKNFRLFFLIIQYISVCLGINIFYSLLML